MCMKISKWIVILTLLVFVAVWIYLSYTRGFLPQDYFPVY